MGFLIWTTQLEMKDEAHPTVTSGLMLECWFQEMYTVFNNTDARVGYKLKPEASAMSIDHSVTGSPLALHWKPASRETCKLSMHTHIACS